LVRSRRFRRPRRDPSEFVGLAAAFGVLVIAIFLAAAVWSLSPEEEIGALQSEVVEASLIQPELVAPEVASPDFRQRVGDLVRPVVELPGKIASPLELVPDWPIDRPVSFLLLGTDQRPDDPFAKTDTMLVVRIDPQSDSVIVVGVPRDICVDLCETEPYRINSVLFYEGPDNLRRRVGELLGFTIDYHVIMNFDGFVRLVDFFGGVDIDVRRDIADYSYPNAADDGFEPFLLSAGPQRLDGDTALRYVRTRWEDPEGDFGRIHRQQDFLIAMKSQALSPKLILQAPALIGQLTDTFETDLPFGDMPSLAKLALGIPGVAIISVNIDYTDSRVYPIEAENGAKVLMPNPSRIQAYVQEVIDEAAAAGGERLHFTVEPIERQQLEP
jgi:LCP family protein required for cell wall assembly